jgi:hypothetical protein
MEPKILGYVNVYKDKDGDYHVGSVDFYETAAEAKEFNAAEFEREAYVGVAAVVLADIHQS